MTKLIRSERIQRTANQPTKRNPPVGPDEPEDEADRGGHCGGADDAAGADGRRAGHCAEGLRWRPAADHRVLHQGQHLCR